MINTPMQTANVATIFGMETAHRSKPFDYAQDKPLPVSQTITPDTSNGWMLALTGHLVVLLCIALAVIGWHFFVDY